MSVSSFGGSNVQHGKYWYLMGVEFLNLTWSSCTPWAWMLVGVVRWSTFPALCTSSKAPVADVAGHHSQAKFPYVQLYSCKPVKLYNKARNIMAWYSLFATSIGAAALIIRVLQRKTADAHPANCCNLQRSKNSLCLIDTSSIIRPGFKNTRVPCLNGVWGGLTRVRTRLTRPM